MDHQQANRRPRNGRAMSSQTESQQQQFQGGPDVGQDQPLQDFSSSFPQPYPGMLPLMPNFPIMGFLPQFPDLQQQPVFMPDPQFGSIPWQSHPLPFPFTPMMDQPLQPLNEFTPINQLQQEGGFTPINQLRGGVGRGGEEHHQAPAAAAQGPRQPRTITTSTSTDLAGRRSTTQDRDRIVPPSAESGGVPEPTTAYFARAGRPARQLRQPQPLLVVLDLNGTLLHRPSRKRPTHFVARRHAGGFLDYLLETFWVVIWSSARPGNIARMTEQLLTPAQRERLVAIWSRDNFGLSPADYAYRVQCYKRLTALWTDGAVASSHPRYATGGRWSQANTVLVDDSAEKARSEPYNLVRIPEFTGQVAEREWDGDETKMKNKTQQQKKKKKKAKAGEELLRGGAGAGAGAGGDDAAAAVNDEDDAAGDDDFQDVLPQVHDYINRLALQEDVSAFIRQNPFQMKKGGWGLPDSALR